ncbi:hypothetical protein [Nostoc sp. FACHB-133]|uniref:hypothetical protein n=1 Tax=Nostoc sp. FACHB-133 TaxID=2692835 RepID=UPI00168779D8|nr:hypothetical protein [Nostoc sp. FACHB-133]MBD2525716.1 hypothetical protein [Nostoc sp. FACHB-133]
MNKKKPTKKMMTFCTTTAGKLLTITGIAMLTSSVYLGDAQAQSLTNSRSLSPKAEGRGATEKAHKASCLLPTLADSLPLRYPASCLLPRLLIAQNLGGIVRKIPLEEVAVPAMSSAKTATNAKFSQARIELKSDGSLIYILRGQNQQGFEVEVQVTPIGTLIQVDEQIEMSGVPEIAVKSFKKWAPNDPLISTWRSTRLGEFFYQFVIRDFWLEIAADGNKVVIYRKKINI